MRGGVKGLVVTQAGPPLPATRCPSGHRARREARPPPPGTPGLPHRDWTRGPGCSEPRDTDAEPCAGQGERDEHRRGSGGGGRGGSPSPSSRGGSPSVAPRPREGGKFQRPVSLPLQEQPVKKKTNVGCSPDRVERDTACRPAPSGSATSGGRPSARSRLEQPRARS